MQKYIQVYNQEKRTKSEYYRTLEEGRSLLYSKYEARKAGALEKCALGSQVASQSWYPHHLIRNSHSEDPS